MLLAPESALLQPKEIESRFGGVILLSRVEAIYSPDLTLVITAYHTNSP